MGVPAFYRWLSEKYPKIIVDLIEDKRRYVQGTALPMDLTQPNPNGVEFDNLYIDMNGVIHPCSHPEDRPPPESEEEMYANVMEYVDRLFAAIRPRKVLFLAIDGVAPRAKMNQQRSRRFRAAQEAEERKELLEETRQEMIAMGHKVPPQAGDAWDSNVITPGTGFMHRLSEFIRFYIADRIQHDRAWQQIAVLFSDANEPGEGEHKIMDFVRRQRNCPGYDPNTRHILHGLDADLIMLGLATHEARFTILREQVHFGPRKKQEKQEAEALHRQSVHDALSGYDEMRDGPGDEVAALQMKFKPLQMLHLWTLREYLFHEYAPLRHTVPFVYDFERVIDDFVFLCFFVGNDFLPHLPSLDIRDGALDFLQNVYKRVLPALGGYLTRPGGDVDLRAVDVIMGEVGEIEDEVFRRRKAADDMENRRRSQSTVVRKAGGTTQIGADAARAGAVALGGLGSSGAGHSRPDKQVGERRRRRGGGRDNRPASVSLSPPRDGGSGAPEGKSDGKGKGRRRAASQSPPRGTAALAAAAVGGGGGAAPPPAAADVSANLSAAARLRLRLAAGASGNAVEAVPSPPAAVGRKRTASDIASGEEDELPGGDLGALFDGDGLAGNGSVGGGGGGASSSSGEAAADMDVTVHGSDGEEVAGKGEATRTAASPEGSAAEGSAREAPEAVDEEEEEAEMDDGRDSDIPDDMLDEDGVEAHVRELSKEVTLVLSAEEIQEAKEQVNKRVKDKTEEQLNKAREEVVDNVRLWEAGWKGRYYSDKCKVDDIEAGGGREHVFHSYVQGLCWVMRYYYQGCPSWTWYYPFHYAPFASDLVNCDKYEVSFYLNEPFRPIEQLMAVLPAASAAALPRPCRRLMTEKTSPILDFYPTKVLCDPNGKPMPWLWVVLLPFIDEERLLTTLRPMYRLFTPEEIARNTFGPSYIFVHAKHRLRPFVEQLGVAEDTETAPHIDMDVEKAGGPGGTLVAPPPHVGLKLGQTVTAPTRPRGHFEDITNNQVLCCIFRQPPKGFHRSELLQGAALPAATLTADDLVPRRPPRLNRGMSIAELGGVRVSRDQFANGYGGGGGGGGFGGANGAHNGGQQRHYNGAPPPRGYALPVPTGYGQGYGYPPQGQMPGQMPVQYGMAPPQQQHQQMQQMQMASGTMHLQTGLRQWGSMEPGHYPKKPRGQDQGHAQRQVQEQGQGQMQLASWAASAVAVPQHQPLQMQQYAPVGGYGAPAAAMPPQWPPQQQQHQQPPQQLQQQHYQAPAPQGHQRGPPPQQQPYYHHGSGGGYAAPQQLYAPPPGAVGAPGIAELRSLLASGLQARKQQPGPGWPPAAPPPQQQPPPQQGFSFSHPNAQQQQQPFDPRRSGGWR